MAEAAPVVVPTASRDHCVTLPRVSFAVALAPLLAVADLHPRSETMGIPQVLPSPKEVLPNDADADRSSLVERPQRVPVDVGVLGVPQATVEGVCQEETPLLVHLLLVHLHLAGV